MASGILFFGLALTTLTGCPSNTKQPGVSSAAARTVGAVDQEALLALPEFKKAEEDVEKQVKAWQGEVEKLIPKDGSKPSAEVMKKLQDYQTKTRKLANDKIDPLKTRLEASILSVSRTKKLTVVLDKRIVVYGVPDVTEDVKKVFQAPGEVKTGDEVDSTKSPIGYFDQDVVRALKVFQGAEMEIYRKREDLKKEFEKKRASLSPSEQQMLAQEMEVKLGTFRESVQTPLVQNVNDAVKEVATKQGLSLVLDKQHVMQGGRNMTSEVVEAFLAKTEGGAKKPAGKPAEKPAASATPGAN